VRCLAKPDREGLRPRHDSVRYVVIRLAIGISGPSLSRESDVRGGRNARFRRPSPGPAVLLTLRRVLRQDPWPLRGMREQWGAGRGKSGTAATTDEGDVRWCLWLSIQQANGAAPVGTSDSETGRSSWRSARGHRSSRVASSWRRGDGLPWRTSCLEAQISGAHCCPRVSRRARSINRGRIGRAAGLRGLVHIRGRERRDRNVGGPKAARIQGAGCSPALRGVSWIAGKRLLTTKTRRTTVGAGEEGSARTVALGRGGSPTAHPFQPAVGGNSNGDLSGERWWLCQFDRPMT